MTDLTKVTWDGEPFAWQCDDCRVWFGGDGEPPFYTLGDEVDPSDAKFHDSEGTEHTPYLCADCCGPFLEGDEPDDPRHLVVVINAAIAEVVAAYEASGHTLHGVVDVGNSLHRLGMLTGRDIRAEVKQAYEDEG